MFILRGGRLIVLAQNRFSLCVLCVPEMQVNALPPSSHSDLSSNTASPLSPWKPCLPAFFVYRTVRCGGVLVLHVWSLFLEREKDLVGGTIGSLFAVHYSQSHHIIIGTLGIPEQSLSLNMVCLACIWIRSPTGMSFSTDKSALCYLVDF